MILLCSRYTSKTWECLHDSRSGRVNITSDCVQISNIIYTTAAALVQYCCVNKRVIALLTTRRPRYLATHRSNDQVVYSKTIKFWKFDLNIKFESILMWLELYCIIFFVIVQMCATMYDSRSNHFGVTYKQQNSNVWSWKSRLRTFTIWLKYDGLISSVHLQTLEINCVSKFSRYRAIANK